MFPKTRCNHPPGRFGSSHHDRSAAWRKNYHKLQGPTLNPPSNLKDGVRPKRASGDFVCCSHDKDTPGVRTLWLSFYTCRGSFLSK